MEKVTLFSHILPEEQERMWVCFQMREVVYENNEIIMEYTNTMKKIGLIAGGAFVALTALNVYSHYKVHQAIADRKVKKQLAPLRAELEELRTENEALRQALAEIKPRQPEAAAEPQPQAPGSDT